MANHWKKRVETMLSKRLAFKGKGKKKTISGKNRSKVSFFKTSVPQTERGHLSNKIQAGRDHW